MRFQTLVVLVALLLNLPALSQDADYPTLEALSNLEVPAFRYADMVDRMSWMNPNHLPPASPPNYEIGDREFFRLAFGEDRIFERIEMELRGMTERVLVWIHIDIDYPQWRAKALAQRLETQMLNPIQKLFQFEEPPRRRWRPSHGRGFDKRS